MTAIWTAIGIILVLGLMVASYWKGREDEAEHFTQRFIEMSKP
jgi:hypothetical protein